MTLLLFSTVSGRQADMRVKLAASSRFEKPRNVEGSNDDQSLYRASDKCEAVLETPYKLLIPTTATPKVPPVLVAAFHLAQVSVSYGEPFGASISHDVPKAKYQKKRTHATSKDDLEPSQARSKKPRVGPAAAAAAAPAAASQKVHPYKLLSPIGIIPTHPIILLSSTRSGIKKQKTKDNGRWHYHSGAVVISKQPSDAHVSLKVVTHGKSMAQGAGLAGKGHGDEGQSKTLMAGSKIRLTKSSIHQLPKNPSPAPSKLGSNGANNRRNVAWHPGMVSICGITYINASIAAASSSQSSPSPITFGTPVDRVSLMKPPKDLAPQFNDQDPVVGSIQYLKYLALSAGRLPPFAARVQHDWNVRQKVHRDRLERIARVRGNYPEKLRQSLRRSSRAKSSMAELSHHQHDPPNTLVEGTLGREMQKGTALFKQTSDGLKRSPASSSRTRLIPFDPADLTDVRLGVEYQAQPPAPTRRPAFPRPEEARWVQGFVIHGERSETYDKQPYRPTSNGVSPKPESMSYDARQRLLEKKTTVLVNKLGQDAAANLGVGRMGLYMASRLNEEDQEAFGKGMKSNDRDFNEISKLFLPALPPRILAEYYYDVWKLRGTAASKDWYSIRQAEKEAALEAQAAAERQRAEDNARRLERLEATNRRRQVKEVIQWIRSSSRLPSTAVNYNKPVVRERAGRVVRVLSLLSKNRQGN